VIEIGKIRSTNTRFFVDQYDLSGDLNTGSQGITQPEIDTTCFSDAGPRSLVDYYQTKDDWNGFFARSVGVEVIDKILNDLVGDEEDHYLLKLFAGNSENAVAYEMIERLNANPISGRVGGAVMLSSSFGGSGPCYRGAVLRSATVAGTGDGTGRNLGATLVTDEFAVTFRVVGGTFTSIGLKVQESSDDGVGDPYADIAGLAHTFTAPGVFRVTTNAATESWKRVSVSALVGTNALILVTAGIVKAFPA
jgi:hypothetical protein